MALYDLDRAYNARMSDFSNELRKTLTRYVVFSDKAKVIISNEAQEKIASRKDDDVRYLD